MPYPEEWKAPTVTSRGRPHTAGRALSKLQQGATLDTKAMPVGQGNGKVGSSAADFACFQTAARVIPLD
jgi:hypothetical protein